MTTANDLITRSFRRARILGKDEQPAPDEAADALAELNDLLDLWWNDKLAVFHTLQENFVLTAGSGSYTIGAGGNFNTTWPVKIEDGCFVRRSGVDYPVTVLTDRALYDRLSLKTTVQGIPEFLFYDRAYPLGTIKFFPVPSQADTIFLNSSARLQSLAALVTAISLPPGYNSLIVNGLAIALCPDYGMEAPASVVRAFGFAKRTLALVNYQLPVLGFDSALLPRRASAFGTSSSGGDFTLDQSTLA